MNMLSSHGDTYSLVMKVGCEGEADVFRVWDAGFGFLIHRHASHQAENTLFAGAAPQ